MIHSTPEESELWIRIHWIRIRIWIRIQHFKWIRIQGFDDQTLKKKKYCWKIVLSLFDIKFQFSHVQATVQAFSPKKGTIHHFKNLNLLTFFVVVIFALLNPDPQHCEEWMNRFGSLYIVCRLGSDHSVRKCERPSFLQVEAECPRRRFPSACA